MALKKRCLGVDFGSHSIKVAELILERDGVRINKLVSAPYQVETTATPAERQAAIAKALRELLRASRIAAKEAVFALPGQVAFVRRFRLPATTPERLERIIKYEARQQIPFPLDKTQIEYQVYDVPEESEVEVLLVAVRQDHIQDFVNLVGRTGLTPVSIAISPFALYNYHATQRKDFDTLVGGKTKKKSARKTASAKKPFLSFSLPFGKKKAVSPEAQEETPGEESEAPAYEEVQAFVNIGGSAMDLAICRVGKEVFLGFTRSIPTAGNEITRSIQEKCRLESFADAEKVKHHQTRVMTFDFDPELAGEEYNVTACQAATATVDRLVADIRRSLDFYISQPDGMAVDTIVLSGGQSVLPGLGEYVEEKLGLSVTRVEGLSAEWLRLADTARNSVEGGNVAPYAIAIGLGFQGLGIQRVGVDFLPREKKVIRDFPYKRAAVMLGILAGSIVVASQAGGNYASLYKRQKEAIERDLLQRRQLDKLSTEAQKTRDAVKALFDQLAPALDTRDFWIEFLAELQKVKPPAVLVDTLVMQEDGNVLIVGVGENRNHAAEFTRNLQNVLKEPKKAPQLTALSEVEYPGFDRRVWQFQIEMQVDYKKNWYVSAKAPAATTQQGARPKQVTPMMPMMPVMMGPYGPAQPPAGDRGK